jgi:hypothetical protein
VGQKCKMRVLGGVNESSNEGVDGVGCVDIIFHYFRLFWGMNE